jgi:hypothetical protein
MVDVIRKSGELREPEEKQAACQRSEGGAQDLLCQGFHFVLLSKKWGHSDFGSTWALAVTPREWQIVAELWV